MKRRIMALLALWIFLGFATTCFAFFIDFEDGTENDPVQIDGINLYASRLGGTQYFTKPPVYFVRAAGHAFPVIDSTAAIWPGSQAEAGCFTDPPDPASCYNEIKIDFKFDDGNFFETKYFSYSLDTSPPHFYIDAYFTDITHSIAVPRYLQQDGAMGTFRVDSPTDLSTDLYIDYLVLHSSSNIWVADDMSGNNTIPEPSTVLLLSGGLIAFLGYRRFRRI